MLAIAEQQEHFFLPEHGGKSGKRIFVAYLKSKSRGERIGYQARFAYRGKIDRPNAMFKVWEHFLGYRERDRRLAYAAWSHDRHAAANKKLLH